MGDMFGSGSIFMALRLVHIEIPSPEYGQLVRKENEQMRAFLSRCYEDIQTIKGPEKHKK